MVKQIERETKEVAPQERRYLRLVGGKVVYISEAEVKEEEVLARPRVLTDPAEWNYPVIFVSEWNDRVKRAEELRERISMVHQMMRDDDRTPFRYERDYKMLWYEYRDAIESLREIENLSGVDFEPIDRFKDRVAIRVGELKVRLNAMCDDWDPDDFGIFEQVLACYEKNSDLLAALQP